jgi:chromosome segregation ATPase
MILECGSCAKMYRIKDDSSPQPTKCPTCNGDLRAAGGGAAAAPNRVKELETKIQSLERELAESRVSRPTLSAESGGFSFNNAPVAELRAVAEKADHRERELFALRSEMERKLKDKDAEIAQLRESADREAAEKRKHEARGSGLEETHARALEGKDKTIQALDASIATYRAKVEALQKKLDAVEIQRLNDLNAFDSRVREREQVDREQLDRAAQQQQQALAALRAETEAKIAEKDRLISDGRQALDREAGERRRLTETLNRLQENADRSVAEKDTSLAAIQATLASYKSKNETLQRRVESLEEMRRSEHDQLVKQLRSSQSIRTRVDEASHLAIDLDHSLDSIEASLATLRDRAKRLKGSLQETGTEAEAAAPLSATSSSFAPPPEREAEPEAAAPVLSQADWSAPAAEPEPEPRAEAEPQLQEPPIEEVPVEEEPAFTPVTETQVKHREPEPEPELIEEPPAQFVGRTEAPSGVFPAAAPEPAAPAASADQDETADLPLISPPEDEKPAATPPTAKKDDTKRKFSWQRK